MSDPTTVEREALLELLLDLGGPLCWTGPIPYNALGAMHAVAARAARAAAIGDQPTIPSQSRAAVPSNAGTVAA